MNSNFISVRLSCFGHEHVSVTKCGHLNGDFFEK
jgi:hypothetical protein